jgi:hypothetical protein
MRWLCNNCEVSLISQNAGKTVKSGSLWFGALACGATALPSFARTAETLAIAVSPPAPESNQSVSVKITGRITDCQPILLDSVTVSRTGSTFLISADVSCGIISLPGDYEASTSLGVLDPGTFQIEHVVRLRDVGTTAYISQGVIGASLFVVVPAGASIPTLSINALLALIALVVVIGFNKRSTRTIAIAAIVSAAVMQSYHGAAEASVTNGTTAEIAERQLLVLIDPFDNSLSAEEIIEAVRVGRDVPTLALGRPAHARWLLTERTAAGAQDPRAEIAVSSRAVLERYILVHTSQRLMQKRF